MGRVHRQIAGAYLADTHIPLWQGADRLSAAQISVLTSDAHVWVSVASVWEMAVKTGLGTLIVPVAITEQLRAAGFEILPIAPEHAETVRHLPPYHGDPFDRMLIAQARAERLPVLTADRRFAAYGVEVV